MKKFNSKHKKIIQIFSLLFICVSVLFYFPSNGLISDSVKVPTPITTFGFGVIIPSNGTQITSNTTYSHTNISVGGNLDIENGASLIINNSQVIMNNSNSNNFINIITYIITAHNDSSLTILNSVIEIIGSLSVNYHIQALAGSNFVLSNDSIQNGAVYTYTNNSIISNSQFANDNSIEFDHVVNGNFSNNIVATSGMQQSTDGLYILNSDKITIFNNTFSHITGANVNFLNLGASSDLMFINNSFYTNTVGNIFDIATNTVSNVSVWKGNYRYLITSTPGIYNKGSMDLLQNSSLEGINSPYNTYLILSQNSTVTLINDTFYEGIVFGSPSTNVYYTCEFENDTINYLNIYDANNVLVNNSTILNRVYSVGSSNVTLTLNTIFGKIQSYRNGVIFAYFNYFGLNSGFNQYNNINHIYLDNGVYGNYYAKYSPSVTDKDGDGISEASVEVYNGYLTGWPNINAYDILLNSNMTIYIDKIDIFPPYLNVVALNPVINFNLTSNYEENINITSMDESGLQYMNANVTFSNGTIISLFNSPPVSLGVSKVVNITLGSIPINETILISVQASDSLGNYASLQKNISITTEYSITNTTTPQQNTTQSSIQSSTQSTTLASSNTITSSKKGGSSPGFEIYGILLFMLLVVPLYLRKRRNI